jgi:predicted nucleotidyltransferase
VERAVRAWTQSLSDEGLLRVGYVGSYARGDWGVGSDLDLVIILESSQQAFGERSLEFDVSGLPVPCDLLVYTAEEWRAMAERGDRFQRAVEREAVWILDRMG